LKSEIDQRAQGESRRTRAIAVEHLRRTRSKRGARSIRQARAAGGAMSRRFRPGAPRTAGASRSAMRAKTRNVFDRAHRSPRGPPLCRWRQQRRRVTVQRARWRFLARSRARSQRRRDRACRIRPLERIVLWCRRSTSAAPSGAGSPARARVQGDVDRERRRSADRTERAALASAHGAVAVMTMHLTTA
jgi:hypothetical protein